MHQDVPCEPLPPPEPESAPPGLTPQQVKAIDLLIAGNTVEQAADEIGYSRQQINRWKRDCVPFKVAWEEVLAELWEAFKENVKSIAGLAIKVHLDAMGSCDKRLALDAAKSMMANLKWVVQDDELRKRIEKLIEKMEGGGG
jgi:hypothetical protein